MVQYTYKEVIEQISNARRFGKLPGVEVTKRMLAALGHPEKGCRFVHVAGTNGKGSVCAFLSSIFSSAGKKVGTFTSPHLVDFRERITINGEKIPKEAVTRLGNRLLQTDFDVSATMFDYCLVMAMLYFQEQQCELLIMETGLGGRLDSTNALGIPKVAVITKIGLDHMEVLGDTLQQIAAEKAGIIKPGCPVILELQEEDALAELAKHYHAVNGADDTGFHVVTQDDIEYVKQLNLKMKGVHQWENAAAAMLTARILLREESPIGQPLIDTIVAEQTIRKGLEEAVWQGRMEVLSESPFLMVDGAHNGNGVLALAESLKALFPGEKFHFIMGVMAEKDYEHMIEALLPLALDFRTVTPESSRALQGELLAACIRNKGIPAIACQSVAASLKDLSIDAKNIAFGSLYFVGEIKSIMQK